MRGVQFLIDAVIVILIVGTPLALVIGIPLAVVRARRPRSTPRSETPPAG
jgi:cation transport ATPase